MTMRLVTIYFVEGISFEFPSTFDGRHCKGHDQRAVDNTNRLKINKLVVLYSQLTSQKDLFIGYAVEGINPFEAK